MHYCLSIILPVYNEKKTLREVLNQINGVTLSVDKEVIIVDDGSTDSSRSLIKELSSSGNYKFIPFSGS
jgi:glycosyltransferase involved in cell wall biosynthesis